MPSKKKIIIIKIRGGKQSSGAQERVREDVVAFAPAKRRRLLGLYAARHKLRPAQSLEPYKAISKELGKELAPAGGAPAGAPEPSGAEPSGVLDLVGRPEEIVRDALRSLTAWMKAEVSLRTPVNDFE